ncbi:hypothetical protein K8I61_06255 [bacterium]|nr:hypothetical protein [bacterium]
MNGDGYDDVLSPDIDVGIVFKRKLYLFLGSANGLPAAPSKTLAIEDPWNNFLYRLAILPFSRHNDLNHDGRFDVTISTNYTYVRILLGDSSDPLATEDGWSLSPFNQEHDAVGFTLATGDVNGDLKSDLALSVGDIPFGKAPLGYTYSLAAYFAATTTTTTTAPTATTTTTTIPMDDDATDDDATDDDSGIPLDDDARDAADGEDDDEEGCCGC